MPIEEKETGAKDVLLFSEVCLFPFDCRIVRLTLAKLYGNMDPTLQLEQETSSLNTGIQRSSATLSKSSHRQNNCDIQSATEPEVICYSRTFISL
jgi:hypothetical protein